ncbi:hypothetical protein PR202_ga31376 [Eleusine coracana subsp. coracana]|uniref:Cyclopropane-fatty-acyl-phospholipid synthase n=1 Tax=Eleusine coracana subsp. coracana TaxID=191504 RepID=A0AAV5DRU9_ELECO|nr:hypothetical protein PR202_ga31376 [Eleusine coracana subsp. coracana]
MEMDVSDMSFSASMRLNKDKGFEWGSRNGMSSVLVQKSNLVSPRFWLVIQEIFKFKSHALKYLEDQERNTDWNETLGQFILSHRYSQLFQDAYLVFSCSKWVTIKGGSESYMNKVRQELESNGCQMKIGCEVNSVSKFNGGYRILEVDGSEEMYDRVIFGVHAPDALKVLGAEATHEELRILGAFHYIHSNMYLHCDECMMPQNPSAWSVRNVLGTISSGICITYWLNILQNIESARPLLVSINPPRVPHHVLLRWHTSHPIPSMAAAKATLELNNIQGKRGIWFCGPYQGYGHHEDSVKIILANRAERKRLSSNARKSRKAWWTPLIGVTGVAFAKYFLLHAMRKNSVSQARKNISEHYDLSNDFFALYLDPSMTYSSGIFKVEDESLEAAQLRKLDSLINKAKVESGHHVLDIGCGWGTLAIRLVKKTGCKYTGITLSEEQLKYAMRKVKESGLEDRITLFLCDYRQLPTSHKFDRIISCEMIEHVGHEYMNDFFGCCEDHLAEHGLLVLQFIAIPEELYHKMRKRPEFIKTYIFPGGCLPSLGRVVSAMSNASRLKNASALGFDEKFIRTWEYYLSYCAAMFKSRTTMDYQVVFSRPGDAKLPSYVAIA